MDVAIHPLKTINSKINIIINIKSLNKKNRLSATPPPDTSINCPCSCRSYMYISSRLKQAGRYACKFLKAACIFSGVTTVVFCSAICPSVAMRSWYGCINSWGRTSASWSFMAPFQSEMHSHKYLRKANMVEGT